MNIVIVGGTRGLGWALARSYLMAGHRVLVCGRQPERLDGEPEALSAHLRRATLDVRDREAVLQLFAGLADEGIDLVITCAGYYASAADIAHAPEAGDHIMDTNVGGLLHVFDAALPMMRARGYGQLVAVASVAGLLKDYPNASLYSASKRAVIALCGAYRKLLAPQGIVVTALAPGYVDTERLRELQAANAHAQPFLMSEAAAVRRMRAAIERGDALFVFPRRMQCLIALFNALPQWLRNRRKR